MLRMEKSTAIYSSLGFFMIALLALANVYKEPLLPKYDFDHIFVYRSFLYKNTTT